ncbi:MAG: hypothetical protein ACYT04_76275, partial [Nostoc sp.]
AQWQEVIEFLTTQGKRAAWVETEFGKFPAIAPDLSEWKREIQSPEFQAIDIQQEIEPLDIEDEQSLLPTTPSRDDDSEKRGLGVSPSEAISQDISPDEMLQQNLDRIVAGFERGLVQPVNSRDANSQRSHPEIEE